MKFAKYAIPVVFLFFGLGVFGIQDVRAEGGTVGIGGDCVESSQCAGNGSTCHADGYCYFELGEGPQDVGAILQVITRIADVIFKIFMAISVIFILWGAFEFVTGGGDPEKISSAKKRLLYAAIGIALALLANGVDDILRSILIR